MKFNIYIFLSLLCFSSYSQSIKFQWAKSFGGPGNEHPSGITIDSLENIFLTGGISNGVNFLLDTGSHNFNCSNSTGAYILNIDEDGIFKWVRTYCGNLFNNYSFGNSIINNKTNGVYVTGNFRNTLDFNEGHGSQDIHTSNGANDVFIQKIDANGNLKWTKTFGGQGIDYANGITIDNESNIILTGQFFSTVDFDPNSTLFNGFSNGYEDIFIIKLDSLGNLIWVKTIGGNGIDFGTSVSTSDDGSVYVTGMYTGVVDFDPDTGVYNLPVSGCGFVLKLDKNGNFNWANSINGSYVRCKSIVVDDLGYAYVGGDYQYSAGYNWVSGNQQINSVGGSDAFLLKVNPNGNLVWIKSYGSKNNDLVRSIGLNTNNTVILSGSSSDSVNFNTINQPYILDFGGRGGAWILNLNKNGHFIWVEEIINGGGGIASSSNYPINKIDLFQPISVNKNGSIVLGGHFLLFQLNS